MLNAHHLIPREVKETRWHPFNAIVLCPKCHKYSKFVSAHRAPLFFYSKVIKEKYYEINKLFDFLLKYSDSARAEFMILAFKIEKEVE